MTKPEFTAADVGCYVDGANGDQHLRNVLADMICDHDLLLARTLRASSCAEEVDDCICEALDILQTMTADDLVWDLSAGDLCLCLTSELDS